MAANPKIIVIGGGLAGLSAVIKIAEMGGQVDLFSIVPVKRSHSVCAQGGINAAKNLKGEGDSTWKHFDDTIYGGDFLANQPPVKAMCEAAPGIIDLLDRMGVPFNRTPEGLLDFRRFGGTLYNRTAFAGATTGQQLLYALDEQVRRYESEGKVKKYRALGISLGRARFGTQVCRGICAMDLRSMEVRTFPADAIIIATGGNGAIFGKSTNSVVCTGSAQSALYQQGCFYANGEFIQVHPTCIPGEDKLRLMSESARGEGGRVWVPKTPGDKRDPKAIPQSERWYFLEEWYPKYGNLVPRDIATRAIFKVVYEHNLGIDGKPMVYLDLTHIDRKILDRKLEGILEIYEKFVGDDPRESSHEDFPRHALHHGRAVGGFQPGDQHSRNLCRGGMRISVPRGQPAGREFAGVLHLRRVRRRAGGGAIRAQSEGCAEQRPLRRRTQASGRKQCDADEVGRQGESVPAVARTGRTDDARMHRHPLQQEPEGNRRQACANCWSASGTSISATGRSGPIPAWFSRGSFTTCCNWRA